MGFIAFLILGFIAAVIAKALLPGDDGMGFFATLVVGIIGAVLGGWIVGALTGNDPMDGFFDLSSWVAAILGSVVVLGIFNAITGRKHTI